MHPLLKQLKENSEVMDEFQMLQFLESNKVELNKLGVWMPISEESLERKELTHTQ